MASLDNNLMITTRNQEMGVPAEILADLAAVSRQAVTGGVHDAELLRRVKERSAQVQREILEKHGILNVAMELVRETRDEA